MKKLLLILLLCCLLVTGGYFYKQQAEKIISQNVELFFSMAKEDSKSAQKYLSPSYPQKEELLTALQMDNLISFEKIEQIRLRSINRALVLITLKVGNQLKTATLEISRENGQWLLDNLPALSVIPLALVTETANKTVKLLTSDNKHIILHAEVSVKRGDAGLVVALADTLIYFNRLPTVNVTKLLTHNTNLLEGENTGFHQLAPHVMYFQAQNDNYTITDSTSAIVGMQNLTLYLQDEKVQAVMLPEKFVPDTIRVCLNTTDFTGLSHSTATISATTAFTLTEKITGKQQHFNAGDRLTFQPGQNNIIVKFPSGAVETYPNRLYITPSGNGRIQVHTIRRGSPPFVPAYRGHLEVSLHNGSLLLVNEVPLEAYLYSVVPSEMPISFGEVPLQVQAVAARSYAVSSILRSGFRSFAAHVDDSVASQVYNNVPEYELSTRAVNHTQGKIVKYGLDIADTRFFSTSAGVTANNEEVWHDSKSGAFPGASLPYLIAMPQLRSGTLPEVNTEAGAQVFFSTSHWDSYDKASPWFRWQVEMTRTDLEKVISTNLQERYQAQPDFILTKDGNNYISKKISDDPLGELKDIRVIRRGAGGNIMELEIEGSKGTFRILKEYNIRFILRPQSNVNDVVLLRHDGSKLINYSILPSAFTVFTIHRNEKNQIQSVLIQGGGNGHGSGMSQWGARGLAADGFTYEEILLHYYPGCTVESIYK
ncbi:MAG: SpoIID/LytB domain-containing protein [Firmicutes bacterium]|nr:SpoIID/LytB domain-containing protein [Bacillota bacterium]